MESFYNWERQDYTCLTGLEVILMKFQVILVVLLAAILSPLTVRAYVQPAPLADSWLSGSDNQVIPPGGGYDSTSSFDETQRTEGFSINANVKLGKLGRVNVGYAKATQKAKATAKVQAHATTEKSVGSVTEPTPVQPKYQLMKVIVDKEPERLVNITITSGKKLVVNSRIIFSHDGMEIAEYKVISDPIDDQVSIKTIFEDARPGPNDTFVIR